MGANNGDQDCTLSYLNILNEQGMQRGNLFFCFYFPKQWLKSAAGVSNLHRAHSNQFCVSDTTTTNVANVLLQVIWIFPV